MAKYFFKIDISYTQKNRLLAAFYDFVKANDSTLMANEVEKKEFKSMLWDKLEVLYEENPRCMPINLSMGNFYSIDHEDEDVRVSGSFAATIYKVKQEMNAPVKTEL